jgi:hypothetical protein
VALIVLAVGTNFTAVQRVWLVWQQNRAELRAQRVPQPATSPSSELPASQPLRAAMRRLFGSPSKS